MMLFLDHLVMRLTAWKYSFGCDLRTFSVMAWACAFFRWTTYLAMMTLAMNVVKFNL